MDCKARYPTALNGKDYTLAGDMTVIIRAHRDSKTGAVQAAIRACQEVGFEKFTLRAKEPGA